MNTAEREATPARAWFALALLSGLYVLSFVDRFMLALVIDPLKHDLQINDLQLGVLFGTAFAVFYGASSLPLGRLADTWNRKALIVSCVVLWSACTVASAFAQNFTTLAIMRFGLAIGEAALVPAALSLISDLFPERRRMLAGTIFSTCGMAGAASAYLLGAATLRLLGDYLSSGSAFPVWRASLIAVGLPGIFLAAALAVLIREPERSHRNNAPTSSMKDLWRHIRSEGFLYPGLFLGAGFMQLVGYAMIAWGPTMLQRQYGLSAESAGYGFGIANFIAAVGGTLTIPLVLRWLVTARKFNLATAMLATNALCGTFLISITPMLESSTAFLIAFAAGGFLLAGTTNAILLSLQPIMPSTMRATLTAAALICVSSFGLGFGPPLAAAIAGMGADKASALGLGISVVGVVSLVGAVLCLTASRKRLAKKLATV
ncbi:MFS transporter [Novosphingobium sp.]|jgi:MFS family permease|uniref:MFS transporter n=1 Tax=Novosphingobium sp. TaxID=1874826 RepID=UPI0022BCACEF|nr:MFS transporter [Novosphingobium sp.]MCZ8018656.1 MFS transporter [Novosphingobium sp.]MCZ8034661.1 MFS transporter [Novosphingobium sp.]MCZ8052796.1 MFS transporter [Novosphingobium sp.]MCZ8060554.1 MFS transporter [Novosphingobium sp.]MCZ8230580.1 MFS transporter [Novosphingobium sp.]